MTGSSRNLGAVIAERLAARGATVAVHGRRPGGEAEAVAARLRQETGHDHVAVGGDLTGGAGRAARRAGAGRLGGASTCSSTTPGRSP